MHAGVAIGHGGAYPWGPSRGRTKSLILPLCGPCKSVERARAAPRPAVRVYHLLICTLISFLPLILMTTFFPVWAKRLCWATFLVRSASISIAWNQVMFVLIHTAMLPSSLCRVRKGYPCIHVSDWRVQLGCQVIITMPYTRVNWSGYRTVPVMVPRLLLLLPTHPPTMSPAPPQAPIAISLKAAWFPG
jgi:hypothetical protein